MTIDFYNYVNKEWLANNKIPKDKSTWSQFDLLNEKNYKKLEDILKDNMNKDNNLSILYKYGLDDYDNLSLMKKYFDDIDLISNINELLEKFVDYELLFNINSLINFSIYPDFKNSTKNILHINSGGITLPSKEYYFKKEYQTIRDEYSIFVKKYSELFGLNIDFNIIYLIETKLAEKTYSSESQRDIKLINNIRTFEQIQHDYPKVSVLIDYYFKKIKKEKNEINIINPVYLKRLDELLLEIYLPSLKIFLKYKLILAVNPYINNNIENTYLDFNEIKIMGVKSITPKYIRNIKLINNLLGQDLGILFVKKHYDKKIGNQIAIIIESIIYAISESITNNTWLSQETIDKALNKINKIKFKIGYVKDSGLYNYDSLALINNKENYFNNILKCIIYNKYLLFSQLYQNKNNEIWYIDPQITNAYYSQSNNDIVLPTALLQEPFLYKNDIIKSFGGIGFIIGHEIIHAIDNTGRLFDENGNLNNWWEIKDTEKYLNLTFKLIDQYNNYQLYNTFTNGKLTLDENITDLGGITFALNGLEYYSKKNKKKINYKDFFFSYAYIFAYNITEEKAKFNLLTDPHSLNIFRVNGTLQNIGKFHKIFNLKINNNIFTIW